MINLKQKEGYYEVVSPKTGKESTFIYDLKIFDGFAKKLARDPMDIKTLHGACLLGFLLLKTGKATVEEILGDYGLVHELIHFKDFGRDYADSLHIPNGATIESLARLTEELVGRLNETETVLD